MRILVVGGANTSCGPMAEGWLRALAGAGVEVGSAERAPSPARPEAVRVMAEVGVDLTAHRPAPLADGPVPDVGITIGDAPAPRAVAHLDWRLDDPATVDGAWEDRLAAFRRARDLLRHEVEGFVEARGLGVPFGAAIRRAFVLDPDLVFLNHGSFGATPGEVLDARDALSREFERDPVDFVQLRLGPAMREAAGRVGALLHAPADELVFVDNASAGVSAVVRSLDFAPGDEIVTTDHTYLAVRRLLDHVASRTGARIRVVAVPFPLRSEADVVEAWTAGLAVAQRPKLAVFDHVTSPSGLVFPVAAMAAACRERGVPCLVDGAHAPGMFPVDVPAIGADFWTGNLHKWAFAPKGCAVLHVARPWHDRIRPAVYSNGLAGAGLAAEFDYQGTRDPSTWLAAPAALDFAERLGWDRIRAYNHRLRARAAAVWCAAFEVEPPAPDALLGTLQTLPMPEHLLAGPTAAQDLNRRLRHQHRIQAMVLMFGGRPWFRVSAQIYNDVEQIRHLVAVLKAL